MFAAFIIAIIVAVSSGAKILDSDRTTPAITQKMVDEINAMQTTWKAAISPRFANATLADVKMMLGTVMPYEEGYIAPEVEKTVFKVSATAIPESFDVRTNWPQCASVVGRVRDQSNCGSCWAFGSTEAFNDRHCIATGDAKTILSPEDTVSCCSGRACAFSMGCNGGQPSGAWDWFTKTGVTTGKDWADIGKGDSCKPYSMQSCAHHVDPPAGMVSCTTLPSYKTPQCTSTCGESAYGTSYSADKMKAKSSYSVKGVSNMQQELMEKGTLSVAFTVYEDFEAYTSGVYQHKSGKSLGGHAIKMIGWGVDAATGTPYWTCVNSWNESWGEKGTFRILRGNNECGIEGSVVAGDV
jgi:cathepsin B